MNGLFITFEGTEGCGKSTQIAQLSERLSSLGHKVRALREPGGTPIGEEIRHTFQHSKVNSAMRPEVELLLMNASRAQLVREVIRPALLAGEIVLCDRFYDSTTAYQGYGRRLDLKTVKAVVDLAVGDTRPDLTLLLLVSEKAAAERLLARKAAAAPVRDRIEEADKSFFERVAQGYQEIATAEPERVRTIDASGKPDAVSKKIWKMVDLLLPAK